MTADKNHGAASGSWKRRCLLTLEVLLALAIVFSIYQWRTRDLLPTDGLTTVPEFELVDLGGRRWTDTDLTGRKAILYFFAPWCAVCNASAHQLRWFQRWFGDETDLLLVALDWDSRTDVEKYAARHGLSVPVLMGDAETARRFRIAGYPTYYVIGDGRVLHRDFGYTTMAGLWWRSILSGT